MEGARQMSVNPYNWVKPLRSRGVDIAYQATREEGGWSSRMQQRLSDKVDSNDEDDIS